MADRFWIGNGGSYTDTAHWSTSSGGSGGASVPDHEDNVYFDANSFSSSGQTVTFPSFPYSADFDCSAVTNGPTFSPSGSTSYLRVIGNINFSSQVTVTSGFTFAFETIGNFGKADRTVTSNGGAFYRFRMSISGYNVTLVDAFNAKEFLRLQSGNQFITGGNDVTTAFLNCIGVDLIASTSTFYINGHADLGASSDVGVYLSSSATPDVDEATFVLGNPVNYSLPPQWQFDSLTNFTTEKAGTIHITADGWEINNESTFGTIQVDAGLSVGFEEGATQTVDTLTITGTSGNLVTLQLSSTAGDGSGQWKISSTSDNTVTGVKLQNSYALGGGIFTANNSVDLGNNRGWDFIGYPIYPSSVLTTLGHIQQGLSFPIFVIGGQDENGTYNLQKKGTSYSFALWRSKVFNVGQPFNVRSIKIPMTNAIASNMVIRPKLYFDNESSEVAGVTIDSNNYSNSDDLVELGADSFRFNVHGSFNFSLELQFTGSALIGVSLPIEIEIETEETL